jgi:hypothetical protein
MPAHGRPAAWCERVPAGTRSCLPIPTPPTRRRTGRLRCGLAPCAFLVVPLVGALFIDFIKALIIALFVNWLRCSAEEVVSVVQGLTVC